MRSWGNNLKGSFLQPGSVAGIRCQAQYRQASLERIQTCRRYGGTALSTAPVPSQTHPLATWQLSNDLLEHKTNPDPDTGREEFLLHHRLRTPHRTEFGFAMNQNIKALCGDLLSFKLFHSVTCRTHITSLVQAPGTLSHQRGTDKATNLLGPAPLQVSTSQGEFTSEESWACWFIPITLACGRLKYTTGAWAIQ